MNPNRRLISTLSPEMKLVRWYFTDVVIIFGALGFINYTQTLFVNVYLKIAYIVFVFSVALWVRARPAGNPLKRNFHALRFSQIRDRTTYHMVTKEELQFIMEQQEGTRFASDYVDTGKVRQYMEGKE